MTHTDRDQVQELMANYALAIDSRDYDALADCFLPDANATYGTNAMVGRDQIMGLMKFMLTPLDVTQHNFMNFIVEIDGDNAKFRANIIAQHVRNNTPGGDHYLGGGRYNVDARRVGGKWKIAKVVAGALWHDGNSEVMPKR